MSSRRPDTAKQRLWLGPGRHRRGRGDAGPNAKCFAYSRVKRYPLRPYDTHSDANFNCNGDGERYPNRNRDGYSCSFGDPHTFRHTDSHTFCWKDNSDSETSSDRAAAEAIDIFEAAKIFGLRQP